MGLLMLTGLTLPLSTALGCTIFPFAAVALWLISGQFMKLPSLLRHHPVAALCAGLFVWLTVASLYGEADLNQAFSGLKKYRELALAPVFAGILVTASNRRIVLHVLMMGMGLALAISFAQACGIVPLYKGQVAPSSSITHGTLMAWLAFCLLHEAKRRGSCVLWLGVVCAVVDVLLILGSSTGAVLLLVGMSLFLWQALPMRGAIFGLLGMLLLLAILFAGTKNFRGLVQPDVKEWQYADENIPGQGGVDQRLEFWRHTVDLIGEAPLLGHGVGSYSQHYAEHVVGTNFTPTTNPHNEYLMLWVQAGLPAVVLFLAILFYQWRQASGLERSLGQGFVVLFGLGCVFNSFILDSREGILFALMTAVLYPTPALYNRAESPQKNHEC